MYYVLKSGHAYVNFRWLALPFGYKYNGNAQTHTLVWNTKAQFSVLFSATLNLMMQETGGDSQEWAGGRETKISFGLALVQSGGS